MTELQHLFAVSHVIVYTRRGPRESAARGRGIMRMRAQKKPFQGGVPQQ